MNLPGEPMRSCCECGEGSTAIDHEWHTRKTIFGPGENGPYRYTLWRNLAGEIFTAAPAKVLMIVGLNPSTATETTDDPTIRRCKGFAATWGFSHLLMCNLFAYRATLPPVMKAQADPVGPLNDEYLARYAAKADMVLVAWGKDGAHLGRGQVAAAMLATAARGNVIRCLGKNQDGTPVHPLYQPKTAQPVIFLDLSPAGQ